MLKISFEFILKCKVSIFRNIFFPPVTNKHTFSWGLLVTIPSQMPTAVEEKDTLLHNKQQDFLLRMQFTLNTNPPRPDEKEIYQNSNASMMSQ